MQNLQTKTYISFPEYQVVVSRQQGHCALTIMILMHLKALRKPKGTKQSIFPYLPTQCHQKCPVSVQGFRVYTNQYNCLPFPLNGFHDNQTSDFLHAPRTRFGSLRVLMYGAPTCCLGHPVLSPLKHTVAFTLLEQM